MCGSVWRALSALLCSPVCSSLRAAVVLPCLSAVSAVLCCFCCLCARRWLSFFAVPVCLSISDDVYSSSCVPPAIRQFLVDKTEECLASGQDRVQPLTAIVSLSLTRLQLQLQLLQLHPAPSSRLTLGVDCALACASAHLEHVCHCSDEVGSATNLSRIRHVLAIATTRARSTQHAGRRMHAGVCLIRNSKL